VTRRHDVGGPTEGPLPTDAALRRAGLRVAPMTPDLAAALLRFHAALSPSTTRSRFFAVHPHLSAEEVRRFTTVDHVEREAIVALDADDEIAAVARFDRLGPRSSVAEVAFVVADGRQHQGVGAALFARITALAADHGVERLVADTLVGNRAMRAGFRHSRHPVVETISDGIVHVTIDLTSR